MKRLFSVNGEFFANKKAAKAARGEPIKKAEGNAPPQYKHEIHLGPDHIHFGRTDRTPNRNNGRRRRPTFE